jgi:hypothetical protein
VDFSPFVMRDNRQLTYMTVRFMGPLQLSDQKARTQQAFTRAAQKAGFDTRHHALVSASLADLRGPASGTVELPLRLFWSDPDRTFDLSKPFMLRSMYEIVIEEASRPEDLSSYLNGDTLIAVWPVLYLPKGVRQAWEDQHPALRAATAA